LPATDWPTLKRILCATHFSDTSAAALEMAVALAQACRAEIRVVHVRPHPTDGGGAKTGPGSGPDIDEMGRSYLLESLDLCAQRAVGAGVPCRGVLREGDPPEEIVRVAEEAGTDLIVMGPHGRTEPHDVLAGSMAERVIKAAPCPVIVATSFPAPPGQGRRHLTCGLDLAKASAGTLVCAAAVAEAFEADLLVLHVAVRPEATDVQDVLDGAIARTSLTRGRVQGRVVNGVPYQEILAAAHENGSDLIVVGSHGGGIADRQFLGSTTLHLLRASPCPVLVVPARVLRARPPLPVEPRTGEPQETGPEASFRLRTWRK
jgi:nucleotide-binding universal stress UspA family protein